MSITKNFRIKTHFSEQSNGIFNENWQCGIDIGYSSVKVFSPNMVAIFPSFAEKDTSREIGIPGSGFIKYKNLVTKEQWIVGETAQNSIPQNDTAYIDGSLFGRERYDDPMFLTLVDVALGIACTPNSFGTPIGRNIKIETGLPSLYLTRDANSLAEAFKGRHYFSLKIGSNAEIEFDITIDKNDIDVMEQPMGTLMSIAIDKNHQFLTESSSYFNKNVLIFDGGHGTLDTFAIQNNRVVDKQTFPEYSMKRVLQNTIDEIFNTMNVEVSPVAIQKCLEKGYVVRHDRFSSSNEPFEDLLLKQSYLVCDEALEHIGRVYKLFEFDYFIVTGGTGAAWAESIYKKLKNITGLKIVNGNQSDPSLPFYFSNVRGYYMYLCQREQHKGGNKQ